MISVVIPAKNAECSLDKCLQSLLKQDGLQFNLDYEVIVVDDGSTDKTFVIAEKYSVQVIRKTNAGPASARNTGVQHARGDLLAFTDADCAPTPGWLANLTHPFQDPAVMGVKGVYRTGQTSLVARFVQVEYEYKYNRMLKQPAIDFIDTYSAAYRKDVFLSNGGFNEAFRVPSVEDQELSFRLARKGYRLVFEPSAVVYHLHDRTLVEYLQRKFGIGYWKAFMLRLIPEKTLSDSHTSPSQRVQILLASALCAIIPFVFIWPIFSSMVFLVLLAFFLATCGPFLWFTKSKDAQVVWIVPGMLFGRALALGAGLFRGFLFPPAEKAGGYLFLSMRARFTKRLVDVIGALMGLVFSSPIMALAVAAIKLDSPGPAFFCQERAGENGKPFTMIKLRTMYDIPDRSLCEVIPNNPLKGLVYKIPDDPRVTRVGRFLRRWSLDELPQFWNVLVGDMSLVGPRPEEMWIVAQYNDYQRQRLMAKPGITGPMQVNGRADLDFNQRLELELNYLHQYSLVKDFKIMVKTIFVVFSGKGAY